MSTKVGRNDSCPCGSGKKFKKCCLPRHQVNERVLAGAATPILTPAQLEAIEAAAANGDLRRVNEIVRDGVAVLRHRDPERFAHDERHTAYHEAGHTLLTIIFFRDLQSVTVVPFYESVEDYYNEQLSCGCRSLVQDITGIQQTAYVAVLLAGKIAGDFFCTCGMHIGSDCHDQEAVNEYLRPEKKAVALSHITPATVAVLNRHRTQIDAIVNALLERKTLTGPEVIDVMLSSGWNPEADVDPNMFYEQALGIRADGAEAA